MSATPLPLRTRSGGRPRLRVVPEPTPRHTLAYTVVILALTGVVVFTTVAINALAAGDAVRARALENEVADAEQRYGELIAEVAHLEDPARISAVARDDLGMVPPAGAEFLVLDRSLPQDTQGPQEVQAGGSADPLKPVLSVER